MLFPCCWNNYEGLTKWAWAFNNKLLCGILKFTAHPSFLMRCILDIFISGNFCIRTGKKHGKWENKKWKNKRHFTPSALSNFITHFLTCFHINFPFPILVPCTPLPILATTLLYEVEQSSLNTSSDSTQTSRKNTSRKSYNCSACKKPVHGHKRQWKD